MTLVDSFRNASTASSAACRKPPGYPHIPMPPAGDEATAQQRWNRGVGDRASEPDMLTIAETASLTQWPEDEIEALIASDGVIALIDAGGHYRLPYWQFFDPLWTHLSRIREALSDANSSYLLSFLETSANAFCGMTPRMAVERGHLSRVLDYAMFGDQ